MPQARAQTMHYMKGLKGAAALRRVLQSRLEDLDELITAVFEEQRRAGPGRRAPSRDHSLRGSSRFWVKRGGSAEPVGGAVHQCLPATKRGVKFCT